jgi:hypothetical protein
MHILQYLVALFFIANDIKNDWALGLDPFTAWIGDENHLEGT